jgi:hypothetical protein
MRQLLIGALLVMTAVVKADSLRPEDFAFGAPLETSAEAPLQRLRLPYEVLTALTRADRGDLRVFDSRGEVVPHLLRRLAAGPDTPEHRPLRVFALEGESGQVPDDLTLRVQRDASGSVLDIRSAAPGAGPRRRVVAYLLDNSRAERPLTGLRLSWDPPARPFLVSLQVAGSDDLRQWAPLASGSLADLREGEERLLHEHIDVPGSRAKYLRLEWPEALAEVRPGAVEAEYRAAGPEPLNWATVEAHPVSGEDGVFRFETGPALALSRLALEGEDRVLRVVLDSRRSDREEWRHRGQALHYRIDTPTGPLEAPPLRLPDLTGPYWRVGLRGAATPLSASLRLGWRPIEVLFIDQGHGPYLLAYGNPRLAPPSESVATLVDDLERRGLAAKDPLQLGPTRALGGEARLRPEGPGWKTVTVWLVLVAGVVLLGLMARVLYRELGEGTPRDGSS